MNKKEMINDIIAIIRSARVEARAKATAYKHSGYNDGYYTGMSAAYSEVTDIKRDLISEKKKAELKASLEEDGSRMYFYYQGEITMLMYAINLINTYLGREPENAETV